MADIAEQICLAVDQIVSERLKSIKYDTTIIATIVDNKKAAEYKYTCSNGSVQFIAFSKDTTYKINDSVQVTIPNGDYDQQKIIIGKYVADNETPYIFTQPFDTIIDVSANLIDDTVKSSAGLRANDDYDNASIPSTHEEFLWSKVFDEEYRDFERLGIQGQFRSRIKSLNSVSGDYGYRLEVLSCRDELVNDAVYNSLIPEIARIYSSILNRIDYNTEVLDKIPNSWYNKITTTLKLNGDNIKSAFIQAFNNASEEIRKDMIYALLYANAHITEMYLSSSDMYGNPYNFQSFFEQEKVFDISSLKAIYGMTLFFYEESTTFLTEKGEQIPYKTKTGGKLPPNLHTKDPYICLGYDLSNFDSEQAILFTTDGSTYKTKDNVSIKDNQKLIRLRWLHLFENGNIGVVSESSNLSDYEIRWYRFRMGAPSADEYSGVYWDRVNLPKVVKETIPLDDINSLDTFYLRYHYLPGTFSKGNESTYTSTFKPIYKDIGVVQYNGGYSHLAFWTDECVTKYGVSKELASHSYIGQITSYITKYNDQSWSDIFDQGFVYHDTNRIKRDDYNNKTFPTESGCMHKVGFWEKFCLAYRLYWVYPEEFDLLLNDSIWRDGGSNPTGTYDTSLGLWSNYKGKNIYTDISYQGSNLYPTKEYDKFTVSTSNDAIGNLFTLFTDSFGQWEYVTDEYGMKDFVPSDIETRNRLYEATKLFYAKLDNPTYERVVEEDLFSYVLNPAPNTSSEQVKAIVLYNNKVIKSNILTFTNEIEVANSATAEIISGLSIWCKDGSYGNYCRYGQHNQLMDSVQPNENIQKITADTVFTFEARFADKSVLAENYNVDTVASLLQEAKEITWEFPLRNSMVIVQGFNYSYPVYKDKNEWIDEEQGIINYEVLYANDDSNDGARYKLEGFYADAIVKVRGNSIYITRKCNEDGSINALQDYRINKTFNASALNNTIKCTILKNGLVYSASKDLTFGLMGTNGTDATIVIDFDNNKTALTANEPSETLKVTAHLYDSSHKEIDFNDTTYKNLTCFWEWAYYKIKGNQNVSIEQRFNKTSQGGYELAHNEIPINSCYLSHNTTLDISDAKFFLILKVTITGFGDYDLVAYKGIPIRADKRFRNIIGPTEVIYNTTGHPNYYKDKYTLWWCPNINNITEYDTVTDETLISNVSSNWTIYNPFEEPNNLIGTVNNNILKPANVYIKDAKPYGTYCYLNSTDGITNKIVWLQPLVILQNEYPSTTINKWNGKEIQIDNDNGFILSPAIAAGRKDTQGKFYGVMIGDWANTNTADDIAKTTGVYGFNAGAMSFAFKDDGTAFIGKSNHGRIEFDGNNGVIKSSNWNGDKKNGMFMDLDLGLLKIQKEAGFEAIVLEPEKYAPGKYFIKQDNYEPCAINEQYDETKTYFLKDLIQTYTVDETNFEKRKNKGTLYVLSDIVIYRCAAGSVINPERTYRQHNYLEVSNLTEEVFNNNKNNYYVDDGSGIFYKLDVTLPYDATQKYYTEQEGFKIVYITEAQYNKDPRQFYYFSEQTIDLVTSDMAYKKGSTYYEETYVQQIYGASSSKPYETWNSLEDPKLNNGEKQYYYLKSSGYVLATENDFDSSYRYYEDNRDQTDRYITLSSAETEFPFAIGTNSLVEERKFRVAWDGTCYIEDGKFSGNIDASTGTLGNLTLEGSLIVEEDGNITLGYNADINLYGGSLNVEDNGNINVGEDGDINIDIGGEINFRSVSDEELEEGIKPGRIDLGKNAYISMTSGGFLELSSEGGRIQCEKKELNDFNTSGFWLDADGFHLGDSDNYFYATPSFTGFYSKGGGVKIGGTGIDIFSDVDLGKKTEEQTNVNYMAANEGRIHFGWTENEHDTPYLRFGFGFSSTDLYTAGIVKKFTRGMWIGTHGANTSISTPDEDSNNKCGIFCQFGAKVGNEWVPDTVYRMEYVPTYNAKGEVTGSTKVYEPARYARFA